MANITFTSKTVLDGTGGAVTTQLYSDPNHSSALGPVSGILLLDGSLWTGALAASESHVGAVGGELANPTSTLTRPADATAYDQNDLVASSATAGSVVVPSATVARVAAGSFLLRRCRLSTNKTSGWDGAALRVRFWTAAPTYANGDNGAYSVATGAAGYLGRMDVTLEQFSDGACGFGIPSVGSELAVKLASGQAVYWDLQYVGSASLTPASGQTVTLTAEAIQN